MEPDYHAFTTVDGTRDITSVENMMRDIESAAAPLLRRLAVDPSVSIDNSERSRLSTFMGYLIARVPKFRNWFEKQVGEFAELDGLLAASDLISKVQSRGCGAGTGGPSSR